MKLTHNLKTLKLTVNQNWFQMIRHEGKKEEYREIKPHWTSRLYLKETNQRKYTYEKKKHFDYILFKNGYNKNAPYSIFEFEGMTIGKPKSKWFGESEFSETPILKDYYIIHIGPEIKRFNIRLNKLIDIKKQVESFLKKLKDGASIKYCFNIDMDWFENKGHYEMVNNDWIEGVSERFIDGDDGREWISFEWVFDKKENEFVCYKETDFHRRARYFFWEEDEFEDFEIFLNQR